VERATADDAADARSSSEVAVADLPSTSGAHWANRDNDTLHRKTGRSTPFRRPPAVNSFPGDEDGDAPLSPSAYLPDDTGDGATNWFTGQGAADQDFAGQDFGGPDFGGPDESNQNENSQYESNQDYYTAQDFGAHEAAEPTFEYAPTPEFGPAPPSSPGRVSFGVTAGPISPKTRSTADPISPASAPVSHRPVDHAPLPLYEFTPGHNRSETPDEPAAPAIGDITTGPGREIRPHRAARRDSGAHDHTPPRGMPPVGAAQPGRSRAVTVATVLLSMVVLLGGAVAGVVFFSGSDKSLTSVLKLGTGETKGKTATAPLDDRATASFELVAATTKVTLKTADLGNDLYKITAADDSGVVPSPVLSEDRVQLHLTPDGEGASGNVAVTLSSKVRWSLRFIGGADEQIVDLRGGQVSAIDVVGGSRRFELSLPKPAGTVPVRLTGSIEDFSVTSPAGAPVRVKVGSGAKTVAAGDRTLRDVKPGSTLTPKDWQVKDRYDVVAAAWVTLLSVENAK
jgi:hypothetical protein